MQCAACRAVFSNGLDVCPRCKIPLPSHAAKEPSASPHREDASEKPVLASDAQPVAAESDTATIKASTLLEFPGVSRPAHSQWRKELSERVREIQERRAREAEEEEYRRRTQQTLEQEEVPQPLGLVPSDLTNVNPLVAAALRRIERARQPLPSAPRPRTTSSSSVSGAGAATAVARVAREQYQTSVELSPTPDKTTAAPLPELNKVTAEKALPRPHSLVIVTPVPATVKPKEETGSEKGASVEPKTRTPRRVFDGVVDDAMLARREAIEDATETPFIETCSEMRAPLAARLVGNLLDLLVIAFVSSPFAAIIELTNGNWADWRVSGAMIGIIVVVMFLYLSASIALAGRTWGMYLVSLHTVDAKTGMQPTTKQCAVRTLTYMLSLVIFGLGFLYAIFDIQGRAVHDHFSGTIVIRD